MKQEKSRTDKFLLNIIMSAALQLITVIAGFVTPRLMLKYFGSDINGLTTSITQYISYISLVEAGLGNAAVFALYRPLATGDIKARDAAISAARISYRNTGILFTSLAVVLAVVYPFIAKANQLNYIQTMALVLILCLNSVLNFFIMAKYRALLTADQCNYCISSVSAIQYILHMLVIVFTVKSFSRLSGGVVYVRGLAVCTLFLSAFLLSLIVKKKYGKINFKAEPDKNAMNKRNDAMFLQIMGVIQHSSPAVIITSALGLSMVSVYSVYNMVAGTMSTCIDVFTSGLAASFGTIKASGDEQLLKKTNEQFRVVLFTVSSILYSSMLILLIPFVKIYTSVATDGVNYIIPSFGFLMATYGLLNAVRGVYGMLVYSFGKYKESRIYSFIQTVLTVGLCLIMPKFTGITGVAIGLVAGSLFVLIVMMWFTPKYLIPISVPKEIFRILRVFIVVYGLFGISKILGINPTTYQAWIGYAAVTVVISTLTALAINLPFEYKIYKEIIQRIKTYAKLKLARK